MNGTIRTIGALLIATATGAAIAQTAPDPQQTQPSSQTQTSPSPSTPPTHPTLRSAPTTTPDNSANSGTNSTAPRQKGGSLAEAQQACKNMASDSEQRDCMKKAEEDFKKSNPSGAASPQAPQ